MSMVMEDTESGQQWLFGKGAVERVLENCTGMTERDVQVVEITAEREAAIMENAKAMADCGFRVLALASRTGFLPVGEDEDAEHLNRDEFERELTFHGLVGIYDPPRPTTAEAVRQCHQAQIRVHMLTGDHRDTAEAIAREVGILPGVEAMQLVARDKADAMVVTAKDFDALTDAQLDEMPQLPLVIARCSPLTKSRMIRAIQARNGWVAMTGDGVNDVSSIREANVGIAMGIAGADVLKDVADIVLADDNFSSIVAAVFEGRRMFDNIQRFVLHVLAQNVGQAMALLIALKWTGSDGFTVFPLSPVEILCKSARCLLLPCPPTVTKKTLRCGTYARRLLHNRGS
jgi:P-type Na+/K+ transporter